jgi:hypothetical protein
MRLATQILNGLLIIILLVATLSIFFENYSRYSKFDYWQRYPELEKKFLSSQYVNENPVGWLPDEVVYAYAGGALIQGANPILILPEVSTLGKYLIGLSAVWFGNENILIMLACGILAIIAMIVLGHQIFQNYTLALISPVLLSFEPLFRNQFKYVPHMDIAQMCFLLWSIVFFNRALQRKSALVWLTLSVVMIGLFISTKFYISGSTIIVAMSIVLILNKQWRLFVKFLLLLPLAILILLFSYIRVFAFGYELRPFLGIQRWIFEYHTGKVDNIGSVWPLIYLNQWYVWWGDEPVLKESQWRWSWPITTTLTIGVSMILAFNNTMSARFMKRWQKKSATAGSSDMTSTVDHRLTLSKRLSVTWNKLSSRVADNRPVHICAIFAVVYLLFLSAGQTTARYLVILQPVLYICSVYFVFSSVQSYYETTRFGFLDKSGGAHSLE